MSQSNGTSTLSAKPVHNRPPYLVALVGVTLAYLLLECAFNARLLDVAGGQSDSHAIEEVEFWGRTISGLAVALAFCGTVLLPWLHWRRAGWRKYWGFSVLVALPIVAGVLHAEKWLIDTLVQQSTAHERRVAALLSIASHQLRKGEVHIQGIDLSPEVLASPEGKTFVALFSPLVAQLPDAEAIILRELDSLVRQSVSQRMGEPDEVFRSKFRQSLDVLAEKYEKYAREVAIPYRQRMMNIPKEAESAWQDYVRQLQRSRTTPSAVPERHHDQVRRSVRSHGIPVPDNWHPADKGTFIQVFQIKAQKKLTERTREALVTMDSLAAKLPLGGISNFDQFLAHPAVQRQWHDALQAPAKAVLKNGMEVAYFKQYTFEPWYEHLVAQQKQILLSVSATFGEGGKHEELGRDAMRGVIVPPLALLFSLLGGIVHLCKTGFYTAKLFLPGTIRAAGINGLLLCLLLAAPLFLSNSITGTKVFANVVSRVAASSPHTARVLRWIIQGQTYAYPVNNWVRIHALRGITFGAQEP